MDSGTVNEPISSPSSSTALWHEYHTEDGTLYYYNPETQETSWTNPNVAAWEGQQQEGYEQGDQQAGYEGYEGYGVNGDNSEESVVTDGAVRVAGENDTTLQSSPDYMSSLHGAISPTHTDYSLGDPTTNPAPQTASEAALESLGWMEYKTLGGDPYYYNLASGETQWTRPDEVAEKEHEFIESGVFTNPLEPSVSTSPRRKSAMDNPDIEYDYDRTRLSPTPSTLLTSVPSSSNFMASSAKGKKTRSSPTSQAVVNFVVSQAVVNIAVDENDKNDSNSINDDADNKIKSNKNDDKMNVDELADFSTKRSDLESLSRYKNASPGRNSFSPMLLSKIRKRFRAASKAKRRQNWDAIFAKYDTSADGTLDPNEFFLAVRNGVNIRPRDISDRDIEVLIKALDLDGDRRLSLIEFAAFLAEEDGDYEHDIDLKRSIVGLKPSKPKTKHNMSQLTHSNLQMVGGAKPSYDKAKMAKEELEMQRKARKMSEVKLQNASKRGWHTAQMAAKIINVPEVKQRLKPRSNPRGQRQANKTWSNQAHRLKIAHACQKIWKDPTVRHAAYASLLSEISPEMEEVQEAYTHAHKRNPNSKVTPAIMDILRKKLKSESYTPHGEDYVKLFRAFDNDRLGSISYQRWVAILRKACKFPKHLLSDKDVLEIFQTIAGEGDDGKPNDGIDMKHMLKFIKTDVPAALSLSKENTGKVSQAEVLLYIINKARTNIKKCAAANGVTDWETVFQLYDEDRNGILSFDEFVKIFRQDLKLSTKEVAHNELKLVFEFIDSDLSGDISFGEFEKFINSGESERRFPVEGDETKTSVVKERKILPPKPPAVMLHHKGGFGSHEFYAEKEKEKRQEKLKECKELLKKKARAFSYTTSGQDWSITFGAFDKSHDGHIDAQEFRVGIRKIFKLPPLAVTDRDVGEIFRSIAIDEKREWLSEDAFGRFLGGEDNRDVIGREDPYAGAWVHQDEDGIRKKALKKFKTKVRKMAYVQMGKVDLESVFNRFDKDGSGSITLQEITEAVRRFLKIPESALTRHDIKLVFEFIDEDDSGTVEMGEFLKFVNLE